MQQGPNRGRYGQGAAMRKGDSKRWPREVPGAYLWQRCAGPHALAWRLRVRAAFFAEAERAAAGRAADALPPNLPPLRAEACVSGTPRPLPDLLPPPVSLLTVAQARRFASFAGTPRLS